MGFPETVSGIPWYFNSHYVNQTIPAAGGGSFQFPSGPPGSLKARKKAAAARAARAAEVDLKRVRVPGDPSIGQRAEYAIGPLQKFKVPASISLGKPVHYDIVKDWVKSLTHKSKLKVDFACDWKTGRANSQNLRAISFHCFRHNLSHAFGSYGLSQQSGEQTATWNAAIPSNMRPVLGNIRQAAWPNWMTGAAANDSTTPAAQNWVNEAGGTYSVRPTNYMLQPSNGVVTAVQNLQSPGLMVTNLGGVANAVPIDQSVYSPFIPQQHLKIYYAPVNLSDLEDESFLNNRIHNIGSMTGADNSYLSSLEALRTQAHRQKSMIFQQNVKFDSQTGEADLDDAIAMFSPATAEQVVTAVQDGTETDASASRNQYKALINKGNVNYKYINKGDGPCRIDVIVWKFKSTHVAPRPYTEEDNTLQLPAGTDSRYYMQLKSDATAQGAIIPNAIFGPPQAICGAIQGLLKRYSDAYMLKVTNQIGTDSFGGRVPTQLDIVQDPAFPLFKKYSKFFQESLCDFTEHSRYSYALDAGQRQEVNIALPGEHYNPCKQAKASSLNLSGQPSHSLGEPGAVTSYGNDAIAPFNKFTYFIMTSVSGANMCSTLEKKQDAASWPLAVTGGHAPAAVSGGPSSVETGTAFSAAHVQSYCSYTENIGAMTCKGVSGPLYNLGALPATFLFPSVPDWPAGVDPDPTNLKPVSVMEEVIGPKIPIERTVRLPSTVSQMQGNHQQHPNAEQTVTSNGSQARSTTDGLGEL